MILIINNSYLPFGIDKFIVEGTVTYKLASGRTLDPISLCSIYELLPGTTLIKNYKAYLDLNPLFLALGNDLTEDENGRPTHVPRVAAVTTSE